MAGVYERLGVRRIVNAKGPSTRLSGGPMRPEVVAVARSRSVPVLVDRAGRLPPKANLRPFLEEGADLVAFSGGKAVGGPQASRLLLARRDLVAAAAQMLDMDDPPGGFRPDPASLPIDRPPGLPPHGIDRPCKVGKAQIVGLSTALELFPAEDEATRRSPWLELVRALAEGLDRGRLVLRPDCLLPGDVGVLVKRIRALLDAAAP